MKREALKNQVFLIVNMIKLKECCKASSKPDNIKTRMKLPKIKYSCHLLENQLLIIIVIIKQNKRLKKLKNPEMEVIQEEVQTI